MRIEESLTSDPDRAGAGWRRPGVAGVAAASLALAVTVATAQAAGPRAYRGKTGQGLSVRLTRPSSFGRTFIYRVTLTCSDGTSFIEGVFSDDVTVKHNRFSTRYVERRGVSRSLVTGRIRGRRASGAIRVIERFGATPDARGLLPLQPDGPVVCDSGSVRWSARG